MSWFSGPDPVAELDAKIEEATSESIPNGEMDIAVGLEITDIIRSKRVLPKAAMRCLKKRLTKVYANPNLLMLTLKLTDLCVKNGGNHFLAEINSKEFVDYLVEYIFKVHYDVKKYQIYSSSSKLAIGNAILKNVKEWSLCLKNFSQANYIDRVYDGLMKQGYEFPEIDASIQQFASNFVDSRVPPDWIDGKECMICYNPFSVMNRKHHCRACGGVFCQAHSLKSIPLPALGILSPVRVCDDCYQIHKGKDGPDAEPSSASRQESHRERRNRRRDAAPDDEEEQIRKAIELSLQESQASGAPPSLPAAQPQEPAPPSGPPPQDEEEMDPDLKAAIEASLKESNFPPPQQEQQVPSQPADEPEPALDLYLNIMNFDSSKYSRPQAPQVQRQESAFSAQPSFAGRHSSKQLLQSQEPSKVEVQKTLQQELNDEEEDKISQYIELVNSLKNDRSKQLNVLQDQELSQLNAQIVLLRPKLNRTLRNAIERYDAFLEMNNKINSITRLYDQFLEDKLNQAYNRHLLSSPQTNRSSYAQRPPAQAPYGMPSFSQPQYTGGQYVSPQATGPIPPIPQMPQMPQRSSSSIPYPVEPGFMGPPQHLKQATPTQPAQQPPYNVSFTSYPPNPEQDSEPESQEVPQMPQHFSGSSHNQKPAAPTSPQQNNTGFYPTEPSYSDSDEESAGSAASRFPVLADGQYDSNQPQVTGTAKERYPSISQIEQKDEDENLPTMPHAVERVPTTESKKFRADPEPLIEL